MFLTVPNLFQTPATDSFVFAMPYSSSTSPILLLLAIEWDILYLPTFRPINYTDFSLLCRGCMKLNYFKIISAFIDAQQK